MSKANQRGKAAAQLAKTGTPKPSATALTEVQLRQLVAEHLGMQAEYGNPQIPGIAQHVLPSDWTPVR
jgi:hypothetical protein